MNHTKPPSINVSTWPTRYVTLHDGTVVDDHDRRWLLENEARAVIRMPTQGHRRRHIWGEPNEKGQMYGGVVHHRGKEAAQRLEDKVRELWYLRDNIL